MNFEEKEYWIHSRLKFKFVPIFEKVNVLWKILNCECFCCLTSLVYIIKQFSQANQLKNILLLCYLSIYPLQTAHSLAKIMPAWATETQEIWYLPCESKSLCWCELPRSYIILGRTYSRRTFFYKSFACNILHLV